MLAPLPTLRVPRAPRGWSGLEPAAWTGIAPALPLGLSHGRGAPVQPTAIRAAWSDAALHLLFECADRDAWGTMTRRDDPLYQEEVVEVFLAPGSQTPASYFEIEVSPHGVLFDAKVENPYSRRSDLVADTAWDCAGLAWAVGGSGVAQDWWAALAIPWGSIGAPPEVPLPRLWRGNFYRIERPRDGSPEFSSWSPTLVDPADFHKPERFGVLELVATSTNR